MDRIVAFAACLLLGSAVATSATLQPTPVDLCTVLTHPTTYAGKEVAIRGTVYLGVDAMNVSSVKCPSAIELVIGENVFKHQDIQSFYRTLNKAGRHGEATFTGKFALSGDPLKPYVLQVLHISHVEPF